MIPFELNKVEATTRCPTECVQKTFANTWKDTLWRRSSWSKLKIIWTNTEAAIAVALQEKVLLEILQNSLETPVPESLFQ